MGNLGYGFRPTHLGELLMRMQLKYNMQIVRQDKTLAERIAKVRQMEAVL